MQHPLPEETCPKCGKPASLCVCANLPSLNNQLHILILQHPQEPDKDLGTARLAHLCLKNSTLKVGLSWPNLTKALGNSSAEPPTSTRWGVLYLGSGIQGKKTTEKLQFVNKKGTPVECQHDLDGIVVLDGTWSQAKALWWRNPWLLKLKRCILIPSERSLYLELRKEPRGECLSTLESIAEVLDAWGEDPTFRPQLKAAFKALLKKYRDRPKTSK